MKQAKEIMKDIRSRIMDDGRTTYSFHINDGSGDEYNLSFEGDHQYIFTHLEINKDNPDKRRTVSKDDDGVVSYNNLYIYYAEQHMIDIINRSNKVETVGNVLYQEDDEGNMIIDSFPDTRKYI